MRAKSNDSTQNLISGLNTDSESFYEAATYPIKFLLKLYQTTIMEREMQEITVQPSKCRADVGKRIIVRELSSSEFGFQELPVCWFIRNIFCVWDTKFVSATNVARAGKRGNICVRNNVSSFARTFRGTITCD